MSKKLIYLTSFALVLAVTVGTTQAATIFTNALGDNNFNDAGNWDNGLPDNTNGPGEIPSGQTATMTAPYLMANNAPPSVTDIIVNGTLNTGAYELQLRSGAVGDRTSDLFVGDGARNAGVLNVDSGGRIDIAGAAADVFIGVNGGSGTINFLDGAVLQTVKSVEILNGRLSYASTATSRILDELVVDNGGTLAFEIDGTNVATIDGRTLILELGSTSTLEISLSGSYSVGQKWTLMTGISTFAGVDGGDGTGVFGNVVSPQGFEFSIDYNASNGELTATLISAEAPMASGPSPADKETDAPYKAFLSWGAGDFADKHDVYFGDNFNDVNDASRTTPLGVLVSQAQDANTFDPESFFEFGQTYYWRIDDVNDLEPDSPWKGAVWSFTTEPVGYPIDGATITATASSTGGPDFGPEKTVDGSGLDENDLHSTEPVDIWLSDNEPLGAWIQYEFEKVQKLHQMWVWNSNQVLEGVLGSGLKDVTVEYSTDRAVWTTLTDVPPFAQAPGAAGYAHNTTVDFGGAAAQYVRLTATSNWGGLVQQFGLSEVRFYSIPVFAREPSPDSGATDVSVDVTLAWRAGREAATHDVYLSTDEQAVTDGTAPVVSVTDASYSSVLDLGSTYFWRVDEVNEAGTPTTWQGDIWNLSTQEYLVVDDFESYNDISNLVYLTWIDGYVEPPGVRTNGSTIGYNEPYQPTMETSIVYDGQRSVPLFYDNTTVAYSEVTANLADLQAGQDWTKHGIKALTLRFLGDPNNNVEQQMYVKINGSKVTYDEDPENLKRRVWQMWYIDLASTGASLGNVTELAIGFERTGAVGGQGTVFLDGIRLYSYDRQLITPIDPGTTGLQAHYEFEGTADDSSGNGNHGSFVGGVPQWVDGYQGMALQFSGSGQYVDCGVGTGSDVATDFTLAAWVQMTPGNDGLSMGIGGKLASAGSGYRGFGLVRDSSNVFRLWVGDGAYDFTNLSSDSDATHTDADWHHVAGVREGRTNALYVDGVKQAETRTTNFVASEEFFYIGRQYSDSDDAYWQGKIDDVRLYDRVLTAEEIAWLAGRMAFDKPF
ncbi:MAG: LamG-like jellyroll fold domain-containing protein [Planctomycetota bacterium]